MREEDRETKSLISLEKRSQGSHREQESLLVVQTRLKLSVTAKGSATTLNSPSRYSSRDYSSGCARCCCCWSIYGCFRDFILGGLLQRYYNRRSGTRSQTHTHTYTRTHRSFRFSLGKQSWAKAVILQSAGVSTERQERLVPGRRAAWAGLLQASHLGYSSPPLTTFLIGFLVSFVCQKWKISFIVTCLANLKSVRGGLRQ